MYWIEFIQFGLIRDVEADTLIITQPTEQVDILME